jgi:cytochrome c
MHNLAKSIIAISAVVLVGGCATQSKKASVDIPKLGKPISEQTVALWNIDVRTKDGLGLPGGSGTVAQGKVVYEKQCASCHGPDAKGGGNWFYDEEPSHSYPRQHVPVRSNII